MLIQGAASKERFEILIDKYCELLDSGVNAEEILVLLQNPLKKNDFVNSFKEKLKINHYENPQIYTFYGLCYNTVKDNWADIENTLNIGNPVISPNFCGLEISRSLFSQAIKEADFKDYNSKVNLLHQLFRRHSLITNNNLSDNDVEIRSKLLNEVFADDAFKALNMYKTKTIQYRAFDYLRQLNIFSYLYNKTDCLKYIKYLILDDADEITPVEFDFIKSIKPQLLDVVVAYDKHGTSRMGFLNADVMTVERLEKIFESESRVELNEIIFPTIDIEQFYCTRRQEMIQNALEKIDELLNIGVSPEEILIITPIIDSSLKFSISEFFKSKNVNYQFISGSEKLCENVLVKNCLTALKLAMSLSVDIFEVRSILSDILKIPLKYCLPVIEEYKTFSVIKNKDLGVERYNLKLRELVSVIAEMSESELSLSEKIYLFYEKILVNNENIVLFNNDIYEKFMFFVKQIKDFEKVFADFVKNQVFQKSVLTQILNSIISENPTDLPVIKENSVIVSTPQKIIDFSLSTKYQLWLDTTSHEWKHDDFGILYNAWVFQSSWAKSDFTNEDNLRFAELKAQKSVRKLALLAQGKVYTYSSLYDTIGRENLDNTDKILLSVCNNLKRENEKLNKFDFQFTPREDQKPVLEYNGGEMAISAVPGAGKTTILLALIIKLLQSGIDGENIFVLTYMDSAAKNFKDRIKNACPTLDKLPNISTIHGLALSILKENSNYVKVGLDENFDVCDDLHRQKILRDIVAHFTGNIDDADKYDKGISALKLSNLSKIPYTKDSELLKFLKVYNAYNSALKKQNLIDYEDMLVLSVKILEQNPDIALYYQSICRYIIEDEAQDSSSIQQKLLKILSSKHKNLIRCGDINQSITTTFTNTNLDDFRKFVKNSQNVIMNQSQRCTKDVYELANRLVDFASKDELYQNAFFNIKMKEVTGKNPINQNAVVSEVFEDYNSERSFLLENIRKIFAQNRDASVAVLVRNNQQVQEFFDYFSGFGFNVISGNETLDKQPVFNLIYALMKFCVHPWQNELVIEFAKVLNEQRFLKFTNEEIVFLRELKTPFVLYNQDLINSSSLVQLLWDLNYWLENSSLNNIELFSVNAGMYYYQTEIEKSNVYLTASFFKSIMSQYSSIETFLLRLEEIKSRPIGLKYTFFDNNQDDGTVHKGAIQIMTYHKSKGGEFDYVFMPSLNEEYLQFMPESIKIKSKERFIEAVKALNSKYKMKSETELKLFQIEENFRLLYVAVTRAKKKLYITTAKNCKKFSKIREVKPSIIFEKILKKNGEVNVAN